MSSSGRHAVVRRGGRGPGLAVPTAVAALVCGGSVFAIAATGALALDSGVPPTVSVSRLDPLSVADPATAPVPASPPPGTGATPGATPPGTTPPDAGTPGAATVGPATTQAPTTAAEPAAEPVTEPVTEPAAGLAPTAVQYSIAVHGPGFDAPGGAVRAAADPSVEFLGYGPTPAATPTPTPTPPVGGTPTASPAATATATATAMATLTGTPTGTSAGTATGVPLAR